MNIDLLVFIFIVSLTLFQSSLMCIYLSLVNYLERGIIMQEALWLASQSFEVYILVYV